MYNNEEKSPETKVGTLVHLNQRAEDLVFDIMEQLSGIQKKLDQIEAFPNKKEDAAMTPPHCSEIGMVKASTITERMVSTLARLDGCVQRLRTVNQHLDLIV